MVRKKTGLVAIAILILWALAFCLKDNDLGCIIVAFATVATMVGFQKLFSQLKK